MCVRTYAITEREGERERERDPTHTHAHGLHIRVDGLSGWEEENKPINLRRQVQVAVTWHRRRRRPKISLKRARSPRAPHKGELLH